MKLLYVIKCFPQVSETFILQEILEVERQGDEVAIFSLRVPDSSEPVHRGTDEVMRGTEYLPRGPSAVPRLALLMLRALLRSPVRAGTCLAWSLWWTLRDRRAGHLRAILEAAYIWHRMPHDVEHIHAHYADGPASVAFILGRLSGRPFSFTGHAVDIFKATSPGLLRSKASRAKLVVAVSEHTRAYVRAAVRPEDRHKVVVVRNGIDRKRFRPRSFVPNGPPLVLSVGRLVGKKGLDVLIDACALLGQEGVDVRCEIVGEGPLRQRLEERARAQGVDHRVRFLGNLDQDGVLEAYGRATVFALPCRRTRSGDRDGLPVVLTEALAVGVPVVTTPVSGVPEVIRHEETGLLVRSGDAPGLASAIRRVLEEENLRARLQREGQEAVERFDLPSCVRRLRSLVRGGPAGLTAVSSGSR